MTAVWKSLATLALALALAAAADAPADVDPAVVTHEQGLVELTDDTFYDYIRDHKNVVVIFRNKTCDECPQIQEDIRVSIRKFAPPGVQWHFGRLNLHKYHHFNRALQLTHFPKVRFFFDNEFHTTLNEPNTQTHIERFLSEIAKIQAEPTELKTDADFRAFKEHRLAVYLSFPTLDDKTRHYSAQLQKVFPDIPVYYSTSHSDFDKELFHPDKPAFKVLLSRQFDDGNRETVSHILVPPEIVISLVGAYRHERVRTLDEETLEQIMSHQHGFTIVFDQDLTSAAVNNVRELMLKQLYQGLILKSDLAEGGPGRDLARTLGVKQTDLPVFLVVRNYPTRFQKYKYTGDFSTANLKKFLEDFVAGKVPEHFRSEAEPTQHSRKPHELVPSTFHKWVKNTKKHLLVLFYKQHDKKSQVLRHELHDVHKQIEASNNITFAQTDAGLNDYEFLNHRSLPLLFLYPLDRKDRPLIYEGFHDERDIIHWLGNELEAYIHRKHPKDVQPEWDL